MAATHNLYNTIEASSFMFYFRIGLVGFSLMLSLVYGLVFLSNPKNRISVWYMMFTFFFGLGHSGLFFPFIEASFTNLTLFFITAQVGFNMCAIASIPIILDISKIKINKRQLSLCVCLLVSFIFIIIFYFLKLPAIYNNLFYLVQTGFIIAIANECFSLIYDAFIQKNANLFIILAVGVICFCAAIYIFPSHLVTVRIVHASIFLLPFSMSIILAFLFAKSFVDLQKKQDEVKRLSKEKEWILERQTELLSQQVAEQTAELKALNATKDRLFSIISHDLRTPIYSIIGYLDLLENKAINKEESDYLIKNLRTDVSNTYEVLDNLLHWSLSQLSQYRINQIEFELINAVSPSVELFRTLIRKKGIELLLDIPQDTTVYADENHIRCIVRNLLSNAIKFTPNQGKIAISVNHKHDFVELAIADSGVGLMPNELSKLFVLPTINKATNNEISTGLGLNLCKELIEQNGGSISVTSEYQKGTSFVVKIQMTK